MKTTTTKTAPATSTQAAPVKKLTPMQKAVAELLNGKATFEAAPYPAYVFGAGAEKSEVVFLNKPVENPAEFQSGSVALEDWKGAQAIVFVKGVELDATIKGGVTAKAEDVYTDLPAARDLYMGIKQTKGVSKVQIVDEICRPEAPAQAVEAPPAAPAEQPAPVATEPPPAAEQPPAAAPAMPEAERAALEEQVRVGLSALGINTAAELNAFARRVNLIASKAPAGTKPPKGEGVIDVITQMVLRPEGATIKEVHAELVKRFPDRDALSMHSTCKVQMGGKEAKAGARLAHDRGLSIAVKYDEARGGVVLCGMRESE